MLDGIFENGFYTVFPIAECENELPQDFASEKEADEYGKENFGEGNYIVETPFQIPSRPCRVMQGEREKDMIRTKADALAFLKSHKEFSDQDWIEGEFWFRYDGVKEPECLRHDYTINHETEGIIGVMEKEAIVRPLGCMP